MPRSIYFVQECPTCGRSLEIRVEYLGRSVMCQHCHGKFVASEPTEESALTDSAVLRRANELLAQLSSAPEPEAAPAPVRRSR